MSEMICIPAWRLYLYVINEFILIVIWFRWLRKKRKIYLQNKKEVNKENE